MRLNGTYNDGRTSQRQEVSIIPTTSALRIYREDGQMLEEWPYQGLRLAEEVLRGHPVRFRHRSHGDALLTTEAPEILERIESVSGTRLRRNPFFKPTARAALLSGIGVIAATVVFIYAFPSIAAVLALAVPYSWEEKLGAGVVENMAGGRAFCADPAGRAALRAMADPLTNAAGAPFPIKVEVLPNDMINAFAAPGGRVVLMDGLIQAAQTPEEVAGVLAHEVAHAMERHPLQGLVRAMGLSLLVSLVVGDASTLASIAAEMGELLLVLSYSRETELAADRIGMRLLNQADIRGDGLIAFFQRLQGDADGNPELAGKDGSGNTAGKSADAGNSRARELLRLFSTHPMHADRIAQLRRLARGKGPALSPDQWQALRGICGKPGRD